MSRSGYFAHEGQPGKPEGPKETLQGFLMRELKAQDEPKMSYVEFVDWMMPGETDPVKHDMQTWAKHIDQVNQQSRDEDFVLTGVPYQTTDTEIENKIKEFFRKFGYQFSKELSMPAIDMLGFIVDDKTAVTALYTWDPSIQKLWITIKTKERWDID